MEHSIGLDSSKSIHINTSVILFNNVVSEYEYYVIASAATTLPFFISIILAINAMSATATVAMEKTEKAFEMLLAQPIKRRDIVLAKIIGSSISSIVYGVLTLLNMFISMLVPVLQTSSQLAIQLQNASIASTIFSSIIYALIPASIVLGLIMTGSIGIIIGSITSDENTAYGLSTIILFIFLGAGFAAAFIGLPPTAFTAILAGSTVVLLPYAYALFLLSGNGTLVALSIATSIAVCIALIYTAITIFNRDVIIAGLEVSIRRKER
ncbi:MAG: ABC transporter permease [Ignisphaera sp.]